MVRCSVCDAVYEKGTEHKCHNGQQAPKNPAFHGKEAPTHADSLAPSEEYARKDKAKEA